MPINKNNNNKNKNKSYHNQSVPQKLKKPTEFLYVEGMTVADVAKELGLTNAMLVKKFLVNGLLVNINQVLDKETIQLLVLDEGVVFKEDTLKNNEIIENIDIEEDLLRRPPIVTVMGHVDHGKTTLLDTIRKTKVVQGEVGGITQHIGAYQVKRNGELITFLDTPGHAAFTNIRSRGAKVTDLTVLVVAADDGVMPQTKEAIDHSRAANVPIIVAINKIDKAGANPDRVMSELADLGLTPEAWGGDTPFVQISARLNQNIDELLDVIQLVAEIENYRANPKALASGTVIDASLDRGRGTVATFIVQRGTLKLNNHLVAGMVYGKVRTMLDETGKRVSEAFPSQPVEITGLSDIPVAGDRFTVYADEKTAKDIVNRKIAAKRAEDQKSEIKSLDKMLGDIEASQKELNIILKGDFHGSIEAIARELGSLNFDGFHVNIVRSAVGSISENDVTLAITANAIIIGFNVRPIADVRKYAESKQVEIRTYNIIYRIKEDIENALKGMLKPVYEEVITGQLEVRKIFTSSKFGTIAGCMCTDGYVKNDSLVRVLRDGVVVYTGRIASLKREKNDTKEVKAGFECGCQIENFSDIKENDIIEASVEKIKGD